MPALRPWVFPGPTRSMMPTPSWPGMNGGDGLTGQSPRAAWMSVWQRPQVSMRTRTCSGPGSGTGHLLDGERLIEAVDDGGLHDGTSRVWEPDLVTIPRNRDVGHRGRTRGALRSCPHASAGWCRMVGCPRTARFAAHADDTQAPTGDAVPEVRAEPADARPRGRGDRPAGHRSARDARPQDRQAEDDPGRQRPGGRRRPFLDRGRARRPKRLRAEHPGRLPGAPQGREALAHGHGARAHGRRPVAEAGVDAEQERERGPSLRNRSADDPDRP